MRRNTTTLCALLFLLFALTACDSKEAVEVEDEKAEAKAEAQGKAEAKAEKADEKEGTADEKAETKK